MVKAKPRKRKAPKGKKESFLEQDEFLKELEDDSIKELEDDSLDDLESIVTFKQPEDTSPVTIPDLYLAPQEDYAIQPFVAVDEQASDKETTISDLAILNNQLALHHAASFRINNIASLVALSTSTCRLVETRRKVKKLPFGDQSGGKGKQGFIVLGD